MSRIPRPDVWENSFKNATRAICPTCQRTEIHYVQNCKPYDWEKGHIIHVKDGGADFLENARPICKPCNQVDRQHKSSYHYMAYIGLITDEEAENLYTKLFNRLEYIRKNLGCVRCIGYHNNGNKCIYKKKPHSHFCKKCGKHPKIQYNRYAKNFLKEAIQTYTKFLNTELDEEVKEFILITIDELNVLLKKL
jgi:hypothetical protein